MERHCGWDASFLADDGADSLLVLRKSLLGFGGLFLALSVLHAVFLGACLASDHTVEAFYFVVVEVTGIVGELTACGAFSAAVPVLDLYQLQPALFLPLGMIFFGISIYGTAGAHYAHFATPFSPFLADCEEGAAVAAAALGELAPAAVSAVLAPFTACTNSARPGSKLDMLADFCGVCAAEATRLALDVMASLAQRWSRIRVAYAVGLDWTATGPSATR